MKYTNYFIVFTKSNFSTLSHDEYCTTVFHKLTLYGVDIRKASLNNPRKIFYKNIFQVQKASNTNKP
jgi:hypothetical protein